MSIKSVTALLEATNDWAYNIDRGNVNSVVFIDLKKAFDTVNHFILLSKLNAYGFGCSTNIIGLHPLARSKSEMFCEQSPLRLMHPFMWNSTRNNPESPLVSDLYKRFAKMKLSGTLKATYVRRRHSLDIRQ